MKLVVGFIEETEFSAGQQVDAVGIGHLSEVLQCIGAVTVNIGHKIGGCRSENDDCLRPKHCISRKPRGILVFVWTEYAKLVLVLMST